MTGNLIRLFNPRTDEWKNHFRMDYPLIVGLTPEGRATVELLNMNSRDYVEMREVAADWVIDD
jgi:hypothetical protein